MDVIILAAGKSTRLQPVLEGAPKPLIPRPDGTPLIEGTIRDLAGMATVNGIHVVTGYQHGAMEEALDGVEVPATLRLHENEDYGSLGPITSIWTALEGLAGRDLALMNGDTYYRKEMLRPTLEGGQEGLELAASTAETFGDDDVRIALDEEGRITRVGKDVPAKGAKARSAGLLAIEGRKARRAFTDAVAKLHEREREGGPRRIWHSTLNEVPDDVPVRIVPVPDEAWFEIDTPSDYEAFCGAVGSSDL